MSDGDNAAPGRRQRSEPDDTTSGAEKSGKPVNDGITRSTRPAPGAAPWERQTTESAGAAGNHTDGVTVADLIAKITGTAPKPKPTPEADPAPHPEDAPVLDYDGPDEVVRDPDTTVIPVVPAHASELPDLNDLARDPATPARIDGVVVPAPVTVSAHRGRHTAMVLGRVAAALIAVLALAMTGAAWQWQATKNHNLNKVAALDPDSRDIVDPGAQYGDENFLIVGTDSRIGTNSDMGAGAPPTTRQAPGRTRSCWSTSRPTANAWWRCRFRAICRSLRCSANTGIPRPAPTGRPPIRTPPSTGWTRSTPRPN